jgi:hypothetical protein
MDVTLLHFDDCPNWRNADERLSDLAAEIPDLHVVRIEVTTPEDAGPTLDQLRKVRCHG